MTSRYQRYLTMPTSSGTHPNRRCAIDSHQDYALGDVDSSCRSTANLRSECRSAHLNLTIRKIDEEALRGGLMTHVKLERSVVEANALDVMFARLLPPRAVVCGHDAGERFVGRSATGGGQNSGGRHRD